MAVKKITIEEFVERSGQYPVLDVRSPGEYEHAHIPGAFNIPLFSDAERKIVGTAYKQQGKKTAIKSGLDFFGVKMKTMVEAAEKISRQHQPEHQNTESTNNTLLIHCWRGGMRSGAVSWLMNLYGFEVYVLEGGYKAYRNWVLTQFEKEYPVMILGGYTGSGKTTIIEQLKQQGLQTINLEKIANHKGSAFGDMGPQPGQEMFENRLANELYAISKNTESIWLEDESQRIGRINIPTAFWKMMRLRPVYFVDIPFEERLRWIMAEYAAIATDKLINAIIRIQKRLGPLETKTAIAALLESDVKECFSILLRYYDKLYERNLHNRSQLQLYKISCNSVDALLNTEKILSCITAIA